MNILTGKVALITGAGSGMGRAGALRFSSEGAQVVVADINGDAAQQTVDLVKAAGGEAIAIVADVSQEDACAAMVAAAIKNFGKLNILWANAGIPQGWSPIEQTTVSDFDRQMAINARGPWLSARAAIPALREAGGGSIVITSSLSGIRARPFLSAYQMAKAAAAMLAKSLSAEVASDQIRVNAVCPVAADTPMLPQFVATRPDPAAAIQSMAVGIPLGRLATAEDIANAALFFASDDSAFITGVVMPVDGGTFA